MLMSSKRRFELSVCLLGAPDVYSCSPPLGACLFRNSPAPPGPASFDGDSGGWEGGGESACPAGSPENCRCLGTGYHDKKYRLRPGSVVVAAHGSATRAVLRLRVPCHDTGVARVSLRSCGFCDSEARVVAPRRDVPRCSCRVPRTQTARYSPPAASRCPTVRCRPCSLPSVASVF